MIGMSDKTISDRSPLFSEFVSIIETLRSPEGCPWDREQTSRTMRGFLLEEAYEAVEAIDEEDPDHVREELGDVLLILGMIARIHEEKNLFSIEDVLKEITAKLIRRHPHVFGDEKVRNADEVLETWERVKTDIEGRNKAASALDGIPGSLPPLERAWKIQKKAAKNGFDWPDSKGPRKKIDEEIEEVEHAIASGESENRIEEEIGDLLFSVVNYARHLGVDPALALSGTNAKFEARFRNVEERMGEDGESMEPGNLELMDKYWENAKGK
jgi:tetrapyrrole methylase family protein / MazG family protein